MRRHVVATAGHVDHGKSALVRALTGIEPDRWEEERRRGLTIDLGFAWTTLPGGLEVSFVDVPGHERFLGNMLAGLGPTPVVCFVVAADAGWQAQSSDHRDAVAALGIDRGLLVITRADLATRERIGEVIAMTRREMAGTGLADAPLVVTSAVEGTGLMELTEILGRVLSEAGAADDAAVHGDASPRDDASPHDSRPAEAPLRLWIDRAFSISGAGTVVTGTLAEGSIATGERLVLHTAAEVREVQVRGVQGHGDALERISPVSRTAVNLRGVAAQEVRRGDVLTAPGTWHLTRSIDVRRSSGRALDEAPRQVTAHIGSVAVPARLRAFDTEHGRLQLDRDLPLRLGDRIVLRGGASAVLAGALVIDADPPSLDRRGDGRRRARDLAALPLGGDVSAEVARRTAVSEEHLRRLGVLVPIELPLGVVRHEAWLVDSGALAGWAARLREAVDAGRARDPLTEGVPRKAAIDILELPDASLLDVVLEATDAAAAGQHALRLHDGRIRSAGDVGPGLGAAEPAIAALEERLRSAPFHAPEADDLAVAGLGMKELAAAARRGRLLRLPEGIVLLPSAPAQAMRELAALDQPFTLSSARQALGTTRRVAVPLLEHLDARGWTRRLDGSRRVVVR